MIELKRCGKASYIAGIDIVDLGQDRSLDKFLLANIEELNGLPFEENFFDVVICGDVLEHLINPWNVVKILKGYMKKGAIFIASIPNVREARTLYDIAVKGNFKYVEARILDKTHLRYFCKSNMIHLMENAGYDVVSVLPLIYGQKRKILNKLSLGMVEGFLASQYIIVGAKN